MTEKTDDETPKGVAVPNGHAAGAADDDADADDAAAAAFAAAAAAGSPVVAGPPDPDPVGPTGPGRNGLFDG